MLPFIVAGAAAGGVGLWKLGEWFFSDKKPKTILEKNFKFLSDLLEHEKKKTKILILGQAGAGKSSLLWSITDKECEPKPIIGQQTDATNWHNEIRGTFFSTHKNNIYVDIPGYDTSTHPSQSYIDFFPFDKFDKVIFCIGGKVRKSDEDIVKAMNIDKKSIKQASKEAEASDISKMKEILKGVFILVKTKSDGYSDKDKIEIDKDMKKYFSKHINSIFFSSKTKEGIEDIKEFVISKNYKDYL